MLNPQTAYQVDARILLTHLPHVSQGDLNQVRSDFARYLTTAAARDCVSWQDAWNKFTGATPRRAGSLRYTTSRCPDCKGRRFNTHNIVHNLSRTGSPYICGACGGSGRGQSVTVAARYINPPQASHERDADTLDTN